MITLIKFNTLSVLNTRSISSKAKNISSKVGRILKTAEIQRTTTINKGKTAVTEAIKAKAAEANKSLKVPSDHIWWSVWLIQNSVKSLIRAYEIWVTNMNKYRLFRWLSTLIAYVIWPISKLIQILSYIKFIRMILVIIAFIIGLITDAKVLKTNYSDLTSYLSLNLDYMLGTLILKLRHFTEFLGDYWWEHYVNEKGKAALEKALDKPQDIPVPVEVKEDSWWPSKGILIAAGVIIGIAFILWYTSNTGDTPPTTAVLEPSIPKSILKNKAAEMQSGSSVMDSLKNKSVTFKDFVSSGKDVIVSGVKVTKDNVIDIVDRVKQADFSGLMDTNSTTKAVEAKNAAIKSVEAGPSNFPSPATTSTAIDSTPTSVSEPAISSISEPRTGFTPGLESSGSKEALNLVTETSPAKTESVLLTTTPGDLFMEAYNETPSNLPTPETTPEKASKLFYLAENSSSSSSSPESNSALPFRNSSGSIASNSSNNSISSMYHSALTESVQSASSSQSTVTPNTTGLVDEASSLVKTNPLNPNATVFIPRQMNNLQLNPWLNSLYYPNPEDYVIDVHKTFKQHFGVYGQFTKTIDKTI